LDLRAHAGAHPRLGVVDVVPFTPWAPATMADAVAARDRFAAWAAAELGVPCFLYGPERQLPDIRRHAFTRVLPDVGPGQPHPRAGVMCVGARPPLVAYNLWLDGASAGTARAIARQVRRPGVRALGLDLGGQAQVSCNLTDPDRTGPELVYDAVGALARIARAELVGLLPATVLERVDPARWAALGLSPSRTVEARLHAAGLGGGSTRKEPG
ncbi:MAG: glutamate formimidoyltransferase, partial [Acidimicrobiales bacterium]